MRLIIAICSIVFFSISILAQNPESMIKKDTVCFKLKFFPGDTINYRIMSHDSIIIDFDKPIIRQRLEILQVTCDSVNKNGRMFMTQQIISYIGDESKNDVKSRRVSSPWINHKTSIEIDSLGNRYSFRIIDSTFLATTPGGVYVPYLFFPFKESCKLINQSWSVQTTDELLENSTPPSLMKQSSLIRAEDPIDTLNYQCNKFRFVKTGQGSYGINTPDQKIDMSVIINGSGNYYISSKYWVPVYYFANLEQKLTINAGESTKPGWHFLSSQFVLDSFVMSKHRFSTAEPKKKKK